MEDQGVILTASARDAAVLALQAHQTAGESALRLYIEGKSCDGFYYGVCVDTPSPGDIHCLCDGVNVIIDEQAYPYLVGSVLDWVDDERGKGFLVNNPRQKAFRGKFFRRKDWQRRILGPQEPKQEPM